MFCSNEFPVRSCIFGLLVFLIDVQNVELSLRGEKAGGEKRDVLKEGEIGDVVSELI